MALALAAGCVGPTDQDRALFQLFWLSPQSLQTRVEIPDGLGIANPPILVLSLTESAEHPVRQRSFRMVPAAGTTDAGSAAYHLARGDYARFRAFQDRVIASIGPTASISVRLDIGYCANFSETPGMGPPVAKLIDTQTGTVLMVRPASASARALQPTLPPC